MKHGILACLLLLPLALLGVKTESTLYQDYSALADGEFENVALSHLGELSVAPALEKVVALEEAKSIWDAVYDGESLFVATGNQGQVYRVDAEGEATVYFESSQLFVRSLAVGKDGALYVGTSPEGSVYRIEAGKRPEIFFDPEETYIWDLLFDAEGNLHVATGNGAAIYKVPADYESGAVLEPFFKSESEHIHVLEWQGDKLLAGSSPEAMLTRIDAEGTAEVLVSGYGKEITAIHADEDSLYFSAYKGEESGSEEGEPVPQGPIYKLEPTGFVEGVTGFPGEHVYTFFAPGEGDWLAGTDEEGKLYSFSGTRNWSLLHALEDGGQVSSMVSGGTDSVYILSSNPAVIYQLKAEAESGTFTSAEQDFSQPARWGKLRPYVLPSAEGVSWETRSGNSKEAGEDWSAWEKLGEDGQIGSPVARFLQWRVTLDNAAAMVASTEVFYQYRNAAPQVHLINLAPLGVELVRVRGQTPPLNIKQLTGASGGSDGSLDVPEPKERQQLFVTGTQGFLTAGWKADDPNGDELRFQVAIQPVDASRSWTVLGQDLAEPVYSFNTLGFEAGYYRLRVQASDAPSNVPEQARTGEKLSQPILIDNEPPALEASVTLAESSAAFSVQAEDGHAVLTEAHYVLDGGDKIAMLPEDGMFDSQSERFLLSFESLKAGEHSLMVTVRDAAGNEGSYQTVFILE